MKRNTLAIPIGLLILLLILPQTAAAASGFSYDVLVNQCSSSKAILKVALKAAGSTSANRLTIDSYGRYSSLFGNGNGRPWPQKRASFTANGSSHTLTLKRTYGGNAPESVEQLVFKVRAWRNNTVLYQRTIKSKWC